MLNSITVQVCGGLGNQMFQYAFGRALALQYDTMFLLDLAWFENITDGTERKFALESFPRLKGKHASWGVCPDAHRKIVAYRPFWYKITERLGLKTRRYIREKAPMQFQRVYFPLPAYFEGYWQVEEYFSAYASQIREDFIFPPLPAPALAVAEDIRRYKNSVSLHVRRGDYADNLDVQAVHGLCPQVYYQKSIMHLKKIVQDLDSVKIYIFSDDPSWVRAKFDTCGLPSHIVDLHSEDDAFHDMHLMSLCTHHIIANSSFSWWGAWLGEQGMVIAPQQWFADKKMGQYSPVPKRWLKI